MSATQESAAATPAHTAPVATRTLEHLTPRRRRRFLFIIHGDRAGRPELQGLLERLHDMGHTVDARITSSSGDAERFTRDGLRSRPGAVVAVGGDGTVNEVVNGLAGRSTPLGILPAGTANDFARQVGIPDDPESAMEIILHRRPKRIDVGELNGRRFLNVSTGGVGAETTAETSAEAKALLGPLAYAITGIRKLVHLEGSRLSFTGPGFELACDALLFAVGNARAAGGGIPLTPRALLTDGLLDLCVVENRPLVSLAPLLLRIRRGEHLGDEGVHYAQLPTVTVHAPHDVSVNVDGEATSGRHFEYRVGSGELRIYLPRSRAPAAAREASPSEP